MSDVMSLFTDAIVFILQKTLIFTIPLLIVALAGMFAERSGIINIALDGMMIFGAFAGAITALLLRKVPYFVDHNQFTFILAMLAAAIAGMLFSFLLSFSAIRLKADQTIAGTALNMLAPAIALFLIKIFFFKDDLEMTRAKNSAGTVEDFGYVLLHSGEKEQSALARIFFDRAYISTYIAIALFVILSILLYKTKYGLRLRACGEHPQAADSVGINVHRMRYVGTAISGFLGGLGGYIYIATVANGTASGAVGGMGFLALAIMIFGNWKPVGIALGSLLFGFLRCIGTVYERVLIPVNGEPVYFLKDLGLPMYFYNIIPYLAVLIVLAFSAGKSRAPKAEGIPYDKGQR